MGIVLITGGFSFLLAPPVSPDHIPVLELNGTLAQNPDLNTNPKYQHIRLLLNEYPGRSFNIEGDAFEAAKWGMVNDYLYRGDTVFLKVSPNDFKASTEDSHDSRPFQIPVYEFRSREIAFLKLADYCKEASSNTGTGIVFFLFGGGLLFALVAGLRDLWKQRRHPERVPNEDD